MRACGLCVHARVLAYKRVFMSVCLRAYVRASFEREEGPDRKDEVPAGAGDASTMQHIT